MKSPTRPARPGGRSRIATGSGLSARGEWAPRAIARRTPAPKRAGVLALGLRYVATGGRYPSRAEGASGGAVRPEWPELEVATPGVRAIGGAPPEPMSKPCLRSGTLGLDRPEVGACDLKSRPARQTRSRGIPWGFRWLRQARRSAILDPGSKSMDRFRAQRRSSSIRGGTDRCFWRLPMYGQLRSIAHVPRRKDRAW